MYERLIYLGSAMIPLYISVERHTFNTRKICYCPKYTHFTGFGCVMQWNPNYYNSLCMIQPVTTYYSHVPLSAYKLCAPYTFLFLCDTLHMLTLPFVTRAWSTRRSDGWLNIAPYLLLNTSSFSNSVYSSVVIKSPLPSMMIIPYHFLLMVGNKLV